MPDTFRFLGDPDTLATLTDKDLHRDLVENASPYTTAWLRVQLTEEEQRLLTMTPDPHGPEDVSPVVA